MFVLVVALAVVSAPAVGRALRATGWEVPAVAVAAFVASWTLLPPTAYVPGGHEGLYLLAAASQPVDPGAEGPFGTMPVAFALARACGLVGGRTGELLWLALNRLALPVAVVAAAGIAHAAAPSSTGDRAGRLGALVAAAAVVACLPLAAWSAPGFFVGPAAAAAGIALLLAAHGRPALALGWGAVAVGGRLETLPLAAVALLGAVAVRRLLRTRRGPPGPVLIALALAGVVAYDLAARGRPPVDGAIPAPDLLALNLGALPLGGPLFSPAAAAGGVLLLLVSTLATTGPRRDPRRRRGAWIGVMLVLGVLAVIAAVSPLVDLGSRHFVPAALAAAALGGVAAARSAGFGRLMLGGVAVVVAVGVARGVPVLLDTHAAGHARAARAWAPEPLPGGAMIRCTLLREGAAPGPGIAAFTGAELLEVRRSASPCVVVDVPDAHVFRGDARADRLGRARLLFGLRPATFEDRLVWIAGTPE